MQPQQEGQWQFAPGKAQVGGEAISSTTPTAHATSPDEFSWTASEFVAYQKSTGWYVQVAAIIIVLAVAAYFLLHDFFAMGAIVIVGIMFAVFGSRKPRVLTYVIDKSGIHVGDKLYAFTTLRSFAVIDEGTLHSITLLPLKRFMPAFSMYFEPTDESHIVELLGSYLPKEDRKQDTVDRLMHRIRF